MPDTTRTLPSISSPSQSTLSSQLFNYPIYHPASPIPSSDLGCRSGHMHCYGLVVLVCVAKHRGRRRRHVCQVRWRRQADVLFGVCVALDHRFQRVSEPPREPGRRRGRARQVGQVHVVFGLAEVPCPKLTGLFFIVRAVKPNVVLSR